MFLKVKLKRERVTDNRWQHQMENIKNSKKALALGKVAFFLPDIQQLCPEVHRPESAVQLAAVGGAGR